MYKLRDGELEQNGWEWWVLIKSLISEEHLRRKQFGAEHLLFGPGPQSGHPFFCYPTQASTLFSHIYPIYPTTHINFFQSIKSLTERIGVKVTMRKINGDRTFQHLVVN